MIDELWKTMSCLATRQLDEEEVQTEWAWCIETTLSTRMMEVRSMVFYEIYHVSL